MDKITGCSDAIYRISLLAVGPFGSKISEALARKGQIMACGRCHNPRDAARDLDLRPSLRLQSFYCSKVHVGARAREREIVNDRLLQQLNLPSFHFCCDKYMFSCNVHRRDAFTPTKVKTTLAETISLQIVHRPRYGGEMG